MLNFLEKGVGSQIFFYGNDFLDVLSLVVTADATHISVVVYLGIKNMIV